MSNIIFYDPDFEPAVSDKLRQSAQGLTLGTGEELEAAARTGFGLLGDYQETVSDLRNRINLYRSQRPIEAAGYEIAGAVLPTALVTAATRSPKAGGAVLGSSLARNPAALQAITQFAAKNPTIASAIGALGYGVGTREGTLGERVTEDPLRLAQETAFGTGAGLVLGRAIEAGTGLASMGIDRFRRYMKDLPGKKAQRKIEAELEDAGISPEDVIEAVATGRTPAEFSENLRNLIESYQKIITPAQKKKILDRAKETREAAYDVSETALGTGGGVNILKIVKEGEAKAKTEARKAYDEIFEKDNPTLPEESTELLEGVLRKTKQAQSLIKEMETLDDVAPFYSVVNGQIKINRMPTLKEAEVLRRGVDAAADNAFTSGRGSAGQIYRDLEGQLRTVIDDVSPDLGKTRQAWNNIQTQAREFKKGQASLNKSSDQVEIEFEQVLSLGDEAVAAYRMGLASALKNKKGTPGGKTLPAKLLDPSTKEGRVAQIVLPGEKYNKAMEALDISEGAKKVAGVFGGSQTFARGEAAKKAEQVPVVTKSDLLQFIAGGPLSVAIDKGVGFVAKALGAKSKTFSDKEKVQIATILLSENQQLIKDVLADEGNLATLAKAIQDIGDKLKAGTAVSAGPTGQEAERRFSEE